MVLAMTIPPFFDRSLKYHIGAVSKVNPFRGVKWWVKMGRPKRTLNVAVLTVPPN